MAVVKYFPSKDQKDLIAVMKKTEREYLSAKVVKENKGSVDLVVSVPDGNNVFVEGVKDAKNASPRYEALSAKGE